MGFRFRKSIKAGPLRINLSKSGIGYSVGTKGFRYTKKANSGTRTTYSLPGTGLSHVTETSAKKEKAMERNQSGRSSAAPKQVADSVTHTNETSTSTTYCIHCYRMVDANDKVCPACGKTLSGKQEKFTSATSGSIQKKPFYKRWWFILLICSLICNIFSMCDNSADPVETTPAEAIETTAPTMEAATEESATEDPTTVPTNSPVTEAPAAPPTTEAPTEPKEAKYDYILNTSTHKFHYPGCSSVDDMKDSNRTDFTGTRSEVTSMGYSPCGRCDP